MSRERDERVRPVEVRLAHADELELLVEIDEDAGQLYAEGGLQIELPPGHPFLLAEQARWRRALELGGVFLAVDDQGRGQGFAALDTLEAPSPAGASAVPRTGPSPRDPEGPAGPEGRPAPDADEGAPYLEQLSVRRAAMGRGLGRRLLGHAIARAREYEARRGMGSSGRLWLTTYGHLRWNRPFYAREGFVVVPEAAWPVGIAHHVAEQRRCLPDPEQRIAMRRAL